MNPTMKRVLTGVAGVACLVLTFTVFKNAGSTHDALMQQGRELLGTALGAYLLGGGSLTHHDSGPTTFLGWTFGVAKAVLDQSARPTLPDTSPQTPTAKRDAGKPS